MRFEKGAAFPVPFTLMVASLCHERSKTGPSLVNLSPIAMMASALLLYQYIAFGNPLTPSRMFRTGEIFQGMLGLMFDRYYGLIVYAPVAMLSLLSISFYCRGIEGRMCGHDITVSGVETGGFFLDNLDGWMDVSGFTDNARLPAFTSIR